jgi:DNA integrity scanning protein DisA with diadenylate cyclase activity
VDDPTRIARLLLEAASTLSHAINARAIIVAVDALPDFDAVPSRTILVARDDYDFARIQRLDAPPADIIRVPNVELDRFGQVKLSTILAIAERKLDLTDSVVCLSGPYRSLIDSLIVVSLGSEYELFDATSQPEIDEPIKRAVFHKVLTIALQLGQHGREGKRTGALFVVGDHQQVLGQSEQMILNPFKGYSESERNVLDDAVTETVKEFSTIDGAFIIRRNGVIESAGARLKVGMSEGLPSGLGARHAAAAGITGVSRSIAITVSQSDGTVRVWRAGKMVASFETSPR